MKRSTVHGPQFMERGAVLVLTFIIMAAIIAVTAAFLYITAFLTKGRGYDTADAKALWLAEAGIQQVIYKIKTDPAYQTTPTPVSGSLGSGTYSATVALASSIYTITSTGTVSGISRKVVFSVSLTSSVLARAIHADGATLDFDGSTGTINGDVSCKVQVKNYGGMTINGTMTFPFPMINPTVDFDYYKTLAIAADQYQTTAKTFAGGTYTGVWYIKGQVTIGNNTTINGSIFSESQIQFADQANNVQITPSPLTNYPAVATMGSITSTDTGPPGARIGLQNSTINGMILADQDISFDYMTNSAINGTILAGNNISMKDGSGFTLTYDEDIYAPMPPAFTYDDDPDGTYVILSQKDWNEIVPAT